MKRIFFLLIVLVSFAGAAGLAADPARPVVVDPQELRKPVADPELGLTEKYDGKLVRFTGNVVRATVEKATRKVNYELQYQILVPEQPRDKRLRGKAVKMVVQDTIVVPVTFSGPEKELQQELARNKIARKPGPVVTVEGKGSIMVDGTLVISEATLVPDKKTPFTKR
jgi:hypothetical protein